MAQERQFGQRFLRAARAVVCIEAAGSVRCVCGARARTQRLLVRYFCDAPRAGFFPFATSGARVRGPYYLGWAQ